MTVTTLLKKCADNSLVENLFDVTSTGEVMFQPHALVNSRFRFGRFLR